MLFKIILSSITVLVVYIPVTLQHTTKNYYTIHYVEYFPDIAPEIMFYFYLNIDYSDAFYYFYVLIECTITGYILTCRKI